MANQRDLLVRFLGDSKGLTRAAKDAINSLDDTASASDKVAAALDAMASEMKSDMQASAAATEALAAAMGDELVAEIKAAGGSVDRLVADLHRAGLTYDEIRAGSDQLAASMKNVGDAAKSMGIDVSAGAASADDGLQRVATSGDQSRNVLANMVGNSTQDLAQLGGIAGTAGVALGQLAEYAADGNITLRGLAGVAGPMLGVAAAVAAVSYVISEMRDAAEDAAEKVESLRKIQEALAKADFDEAAKELTTQYKNTIRTMEQFGFTTEDVVDTIAGQGNVIEELNQRLDEASEAYDAAALAAYNGDEGAQALADSYGEQTNVLADLIDELTFARDEYAKVSTEAEESASIQERFALALKTSGVAASEQAAAVREAGGEYREANDRARELLETTEELYGIERDAIERRYDFIDAQTELADALDDSNASLEQQFDAAIRSSEAFATLNGESLNTQGATRRQIESLQGLINTLAPGSPLRNALQGYLDQLRAIPAKVSTQTELRVRGATLTRTGDTFGWNPQPGQVIVGADGGIVNRPTMALIGEAGPEAVVPLDRSPGNRPLPAGGLAAAPMVVNITTGADPEDVVRAIERYRKRNGSLPFI